MYKATFLILALNLSIVSQTLGQSTLVTVPPANAAGPGTASSIATPDPEPWRFAWYGGQWWYYTPQNTWVVWTGTAWVPYESTVPVVGSGAAIAARPNYWPPEATYLGGFGPDSFASPAYGDYGHYARYVPGYASPGYPVAGTSVAPAVVAPSTPTSVQP